MSSHHIVREKQEPALLVLGLDYFPDELLGQLLEWSPTVIATADTAERLVSSGIKIDWIITHNPAEEIQSDVKLIDSGDGNLIWVALNFLSVNSYPSVNIITNDLQLTEYALFIDRIGIVIFLDHQKIYPVGSGFSKWKLKDEVIKLLNKGDNIVADGLEKINDQLYKTIHDGFFSLRFDNAYLFVAEEI